MNAIVARYHWDDREKMENDYCELQKLYEQALNSLAAQLNRLHAVDYSLRYWRILIGPWLGYFTQMLFDRWYMLESVVGDKNILGAKVVTRSPGEFVPNDMASFIPLFVSDAWNEQIYGQILQNIMFPIEWVKSKIGKDCSVNAESEAFSKNTSFHKILKKLGLSAFEKLQRPEENFFISTYLATRLHLALKMRLGELPTIRRVPSSPSTPYQPLMRQWPLNVRADCCPGFYERFARILEKMIPIHIPTVYLEGYKKALEVAQKTPWPKRPRSIFDSNSWLAEDIFKIWAAEKVEHGTPLIIGQHGGSYGIAKYSFCEDHQIAISDRFLTWGWSRQNESRVIPLGNFRDYARKQTWNPRGKALLVQGAIPRYSYWLYSTPVAAGQWQSYFEDQCRFVNDLPVNLREQLLVRLYPHDYSHGQLERWKNRFPGIALDQGDRPIHKLLKQTRLCVSTYNATSYLESLALNIPTLIFWNPRHWEIREEAKPFFKQLEDAGIFHETPEGAAHLMTCVWEEIKSWWEGCDVQKARREFCREFSSTSKDLENRLTALFRKFPSARCNLVE